jgi:hypothetical protein
MRLYLVVGKSDVQIGKVPAIRSAKHSEQGDAEAEEKGGMQKRQPGMRGGPCETAQNRNHTPCRAKDGAGEKAESPYINVILSSETLNWIDSRRARTLTA